MSKKRKGNYKGLLESSVELLEPMLNQPLILQFVTQSSWFSTLVKNSYLCIKLVNFVVQSTRCEIGVGCSQQIMCVISSFPNVLHTIFFAIKLEKVKISMEVMRGFVNILLPHTVHWSTINALSAIINIVNALYNYHGYVHFSNWVAKKSFPIFTIFRIFWTYLPPRSHLSYTLIHVSHVIGKGSRKQ